MVANRNIQLDRIRLRTPVIFLVLASQQEELIAKLDREVNEQTCHFAAQIDRLDAVPWVDRRVAEVVLAEVGADMKPFPTHNNPTSWAGMCPGMKKVPGNAVGGESLRQFLAKANTGASRLGS